MRTFPEKTTIKYIVTWEGGDSFFGPFDTKEEAARWGRVALDNLVVKELTVPKDYDLDESEFSTEVLIHSGLDMDGLSPVLSEKVYSLVHQEFEADSSIEETVKRVADIINKDNEAYSRWLAWTLEGDVPPWDRQDSFETATS
jgi:hypothetical protein